MSMGPVLGTGQTPFGRHAGSQPPATGQGSAVVDPVTAVMVTLLAVFDVGMLVLLVRGWWQGRRK